jgi:hypothetical protein
VGVAVRLCLSRSGGRLNCHVGQAFSDTERCAAHPGRDGGYGAGHVGAFLVVPFAMLGARGKTSPPAIVMMLAAFWALVPGALSFESLGEAAAGEGDITTLGVGTIGGLQP